MKIDHPGYYLWQSKEAYVIVDVVNSPLLRDAYHQHIIGKDTFQEINRKKEHFLIGSIRQC